jgi:hypothetical protein
MKEELSPKEIGRVMALSLYEFNCAIGARAFDKPEYITHAAKAYRVPEADIIRVLDVGEEIYGLNEPLKIMDYIDGFYLGKHNSDRVDLEEIAHETRGS